MKSIIAINEFMQTNNVKSDKFGNLKFQAFVEYRSPTVNTSEMTTVNIKRNGYQDGEVSLQETGSLVAEHYHLDFNTRYQEYEFSKADKTLLISGSSIKMGGKYTASISPA